VNKDYYKSVSSKEGKRGKNLWSMWAGFKPGMDDEELELSTIRVVSQQRKRVTNSMVIMWYLSIYTSSDVCWRAILNGAVPSLRVNALRFLQCFHIVG